MVMLRHLITITISLLIVGNCSAVSDDVFLRGTDGLNTTVALNDDDASSKRLLQSLVCPDCPNLARSCKGMAADESTKVGAPACITEQSSLITTDAGGNSWLAVDGNIDQNYKGDSVTHTVGGESGWWRVDLEAPQNKLEEIVIYGRADCCTGRLHNLKVEVLDDTGRVVATRMGPAASVPVGAIFHFDLSAEDVVGKSVKVTSNADQPLSLAEVQVYGRALVDLPEWSPCSSSKQCRAWTDGTGCCTGKYSDRLPKCTPLSRGFNLERNGCIDIDCIAKPALPLSGTTRIFPIPDDDLLSVASAVITTGYDSTLKAKKDRLLCHWTNDAREDLFRSTTYALSFATKDQFLDLMDEENDNFCPQLKRWNDLGATMYDYRDVRRLWCEKLHSGDHPQLIPKNIRQCMCGSSDPFIKCMMMYAAFIAPKPDIGVVHLVCPDCPNLARSCKGMAADESTKVGAPACITEQSSLITTDAGGNSWLAVDGNIDQNYKGDSVTHTVGGESGWWRVDLEAPQNKLEEIVIYGRADCCTGRLHNLKVEVLDDTGRVVATRMGPAASVPVGAIFHFDLSAEDVVGKSVKVTSNADQPLSLAEVQVYGRALVDLPEWSPCSSSKQCRAWTDGTGCCTGKYSEGVNKCVSWTNDFFFYSYNGCIDTGGQECVERPSYPSEAAGRVDDDLLSLTTALMSAGIDSSTLDSKKGALWCYWTEEAREDLQRSIMHALSRASKSQLLDLMDEGSNNFCLPIKSMNDLGAVDDVGDGKTYREHMCDTISSQNSLVPDYVRRCMCGDSEPFIRCQMMLGDAGVLHHERRKRERRELRDRERSLKTDCKFTSTPPTLTKNGKFEKDNLEGLFGYITGLASGDADSFAVGGVCTWPLVPPFEIEGSLSMSVPELHLDGKSSQEYVDMAGAVKGGINGKICFSLSLFDDDTLDSVVGDFLDFIGLGLCFASLSLNSWPLREHVRFDSELRVGDFFTFGAAMAWQTGTAIRDKLGLCENVESGCKDIDSFFCVMSTGNVMGYVDISFNFFFFQPTISVALGESKEYAECHGRGKLADGKVCFEGISCHQCKNKATHWYSKGLSACGNEPKWPDGQMCSLGPLGSCNACKNRATFWPDHRFTWACGEMPCWEDDTECFTLGDAIDILGMTSCNSCCNGHAGGKCGRDRHCWKDHKPCVPYVTCGSCCNGARLGICGQHAEFYHVGPFSKLPS